MRFFTFILSGSVLYLSGILLCSDMAQAAYPDSLSHEPLAQCISPTCWPQGSTAVQAQAEPGPFSQSPSVRPVWSQTTMDLCFWHMRIVDTFAQLFPEFALTAEGACHRSDTAQQMSRELRNLYFYQATGTLPVLKISLLRTSRPNAFAAPGNAQENQPPTIFLSIGLLRLIDNESQLAFVIAHEMAHILGDHFKPGLPVAMFTAKQLAHITRVHQEWEYRADYYALERVIRNGFDAQSAVDILGQLASIDEFQTTLFGADHPDTTSRISGLEQTINGKTRKNRNLNTALLPSGSQATVR